MPFFEQIGVGFHVVHHVLQAVRANRSRSGWNIERAFCADGALFDVQAGSRRRLKRERGRMRAMGRCVTQVLR